MIKQIRQTIRAFHNEPRQRVRKRMARMIGQLAVKACDLRSETPPRSQTARTGTLAESGTE